MKNLAKLLFAPVLLLMLNPVNGQDRESATNLFKHCIKKDTFALEIGAHDINVAPLDTFKKILKVFPNSLALSYQLNFDTNLILTNKFWDRDYSAAIKADLSNVSDRVKTEESGVATLTVNFVYFENENDSNYSCGLSGKKALDIISRAGYRPLTYREFIYLVEENNERLDDEIGLVKFVILGSEITHWERKFFPLIFPLLNQKKYARAYGQLNDDILYNIDLPQRSARGYNFNCLFPVVKI